MVSAISEASNGLSRNSGSSRIVKRGGAILRGRPGGIPSGMVPVSKQQGGSFGVSSLCPLSEQQLPESLLSVASSQDGNPDRTIPLSMRQMFNGIPTAGMNIPKQSSSSIETNWRMKRKLIPRIGAASKTFRREGGIREHPCREAFSVADWGLWSRNSRRRSA